MPYEHTSMDLISHEHRTQRSLLTVSAAEEPHLLSRIVTTITLEDTKELLETRIDIHSSCRISLPSPPSQRW
jgi:hypothetical protein